MKQRLGISLISAWYVLIGLLLLLIAFGIVFGGTEVEIPEEIVSVGAGVFGIVALIAFTLAYGIYNLESWGWYATFALNAVCMIVAIPQGNICWLIIPALIILYLWNNQRDFGVRVTI